MDLSKTVFVSDLDGTLLTTDKHISAIDEAAIRRYTELGGRFTIATGRPIQTTVKYLDKLPGSLPLILYNGCIIYDHRKDKTLYASYLPEVSREILSDVREMFPDISPEIFTFYGQYFFHYNAAEIWHQSILEMRYTKIDSPDLITEPWCKMLFADETEIIDELAGYVERFAGMGVHFVRSSPKFLEILPEGISKGSAIIKLKELCKLENCTFIAAGDYDNDIEMIDAADMSFCPSDSRECVKEAAWCVLENTCDSGAIAEAIGILEKCK